MVHARILAYLRPFGGTLIIEVVPVSTLSPDPDNVRLHGPENLSAITNSLQAFGLRKPLVVRGSTVIAGNGTLAAAISLGWTDIEITRVPSDWSDNDARAYALADNKSAELATWDTGLEAQLLELDYAGVDASQFGFDPVLELLDEKPPPDFPKFDDDTETTYCCPKCQYEWNGAPK